MKFKLKKSRLMLSFLAGAAYSFLFLLAMTVFGVGLSLASLVALGVLTVLVLTETAAPQLALNIAGWFAGVIISAFIEYAADFVYLLQPDWGEGDDFGIVVFLPFFAAAGVVTILAAVILSIVRKRK